MRRQAKVSQDEVFEKLAVPHALRVMVVPAVISQLIVLIYNMADTFYVGQTNNPYMVAGTSLILPVFNISLCLAGLAGVGGGALISRLLGENREEEARKVSVFSLYLGILIAALFSLGMGVFMKPVLGFLGAGEHTYLYASQYAFCVIVAGGVPTVLSNVLSNLIRSVGRSREAGTGIVLGGVLNIILDPLFMFVLLPEGWEVLGAGIATCLSNCIACLYFILVMASMGRGAVITFSPRAGRASKESMREVFAVGIPSAIATFLFDLDYMIIDKMMAAYHDLALAAIGIVLKVERFPLNAGIHPAVQTAGAYDCTDQYYSLRDIRSQLYPAVHCRRQDSGYGVAVPADPGSGHAADVLKLFYRLSVPGLRQGKDRPVSGCDALAGI